MCEGELLEERRLSEGIGLNALGLLHGHLKTIATDEACSTLTPNEEITSKIQQLECISC